MANKKSVGTNFDPYLVGLQFTSDGGSPLFTMGNFQITSNLTPPPARTFQLGTFSDPITLEKMGTNLENAVQLVNDNLGVFLNLNSENLLNYTLFGSFTEFVRVTLEQIQLLWPGSIFVYYSYGSITGNTADNILYDSASDTTTFRCSTNFFYNKYGINYLSNSVSFTGTSIQSSLKNLSISYLDYTLFINNISYEILEFTPATNLLNDFCFFKVKGNPFNGQLIVTESFHIKPTELYLEKFFSSIDDFSRFLLNRNTLPIYTSTIFYEEENDSYQILQKAQNFSWPVTDGYNLDKDTGDFLIYQSKLLEIVGNYDEYRTDLMRRVLVTTSVSYFESNPANSINGTVVNTSDKIDKLLNITGRQFDEVKKWIDGISYAQTVSYDKQGNTPDAYIKDFARYLGWDLLSPMDENELLQNFIPNQSQYSGMSVGYTPAEAEVEFWRRLILNSGFLWKSKGTRKPIEFLFEFINTPPSLVNFNEYIYQAKNKLNITAFKNILKYILNDTDISPYNVDEEGFPKIPIETLDMYFQKAGEWYRETAGPGSQVDYYGGNNPHIGPYDGGQEYINQFRCLLDVFSGQTIKITEEFFEFTNLFKNYYEGTVDGYVGNIYLETVTPNNDPMNCIIVSGTVINNPSKDPEYSICGCAIPSGSSQVIIINVKKNPIGKVTCSGTTNDGKPVVDGLAPCQSCIAYQLVGTNPFISYQCGQMSTYMVPIECCQSMDTAYNFTWIESNNNSGLGICYYTDPCSSTLQFLGQNGGYMLWFDTVTLSSTSIVPEHCCLYHGGVYDFNTQKCKSP
jgi:hypothetical protein